MLPFWRRQPPSPPPSEPESAEPDAFDWQAELAREHGLSLGRRSTRMPPSAPEHEPETFTAEDLTGPINWQAELVREHALPPRRSRLPRALEAALQGPKGYSVSEGFTPEMVPADFEEYKALLHQVFEGPLQRLAVEALRQPAFKSAFAAWEPGNHRVNTNVFHEVYERLSTMMGRIYRFAPAPLGMDDVHLDNHGSNAVYIVNWGRIAVSRRAFDQPVAGVFNSIVHEQIHCLQQMMMLRIDWPSAHPLTLPERALAYYWRREEPRYARRMAEAFADMREGRGSGAYRRIPVEYHAFWTGDHIESVLVCAYGR